MRRTISILALVAALPGLAWAAQPAPASASPAHGDHDSSPAAAVKRLPAVKGVVAWSALTGVEWVRENNRFVASFPQQVRALANTEVRLQGFMMPLDTGERQRRFMLSAMPPSCAFCMPGGPDQVAEVHVRSPVRYTLDPVVISGRLTLLPDDPMGLWYRLTDAVVVPR